MAPRTWLLATIAGWALLLWLLALVGMGAAIGRLPDDPTLTARLPVLAPPSPERLGTMAQYAEISARPLWSEDRRPQPFSLQPEGDGEGTSNAFDYMLTSVLLTPGLRMAIIQPSAGGESIRIKLGTSADEVPAWRLVALNPRSAIFEGPGGERTLDLRVYDGTGGEAPTQSRMPIPAPPGSVVDAASAPQVAAPAAGKPAAIIQNKPQPAMTKPAETPADASALQEQQLNAIRKRIEARRAQLRQEAEQPAPPAKTP
ncbi:MAG TPA: hypothetical protein VHF02_05095 [Luteimonas sp.]|nr:hypothetical protein [Luteimonas sp.]